ncbi:acyltransferase family protein [Methylobacter sp.]|uniref:acyltransferase family protein n=1 Tax=Methylobacter sp. TaxID=2051955 RepID=UPI003DA3BAA6
MEFKKLSDYVSKGKDNNFNLIRFFAAIAVLLSHSYPLALGKFVNEPFESALGINLGEIALDIFFVTSGFLVTGSLLKRDSIKQFLLARIVRIYPGLFFSVLFMVLFIGVFNTNLPLWDYLTDKKVFLFAINNSIMLGKDVKFYLPEVFLSNPYPYVVNGSLWSLPWEIRMYLLLVLFSILNKLTLTYRSNVCNCVLLMYLFSFIFYLLGKLSNYHYHIFIQHILHFSIIFFSGSLFYFYKEKIILNEIMFFLVIIAAFIFIKSGLNIKVIYLLIFPYAVIFLAYVPSGFIRYFNTIGDYSYGIYLYAFPVQQYIISYNNVTPFELSMYSIPFVILISIFSWHFIESPFLKLIRKK